MTHFDVWWNEGEGAVVSMLIPKNRPGVWVKIYPDMPTAAHDALALNLVTPNVAEELRSLSAGFIEISVSVGVAQPKELLGSRFGWTPFKGGFH
jgi:hypothetical protein